METVCATNPQPDWKISSAEAAILKARDTLFSILEQPSRLQDNMAQFEPASCCFPLVNDDCRLVLPDYPDKGFDSLHRFRTPAAIPLEFPRNFDFADPR